MRMKTQDSNGETRVFNVLKTYCGDWVSTPEIATIVSLAHNTTQKWIQEARKRAGEFGFSFEKRRVKGKNYNEYRFVRAV